MDEADVEPLELVQRPEEYEAACSGYFHGLAAWPAIKAGMAVIGGSQKSEYNTTRRSRRDTAQTGQSENRPGTLFAEFLLSRLETRCSPRRIIYGI
jgi:hypothetical protein